MKTSKRNLKKKRIWVSRKVELTDNWKEKLNLSKGEQLLYCWQRNNLSKLEHGVWGLQEVAFVKKVNSAIQNETGYLFFKDKKRQLQSGVKKKQDENKQWSPNEIFTSFISNW